jgi:hypothetical protein
MRDKLNESKAAQAGLVVVLALVAILFYMHSKGGSESSEESVAPEEGVVTTEVATTGAGGATGALPTTIADTKAPPHTFRAAYEADEPVALLIVHNGGIDDHYTEEALKAVAHFEDLRAFVVPLKRLPEYASVTVGLNITQVPAMIVLRPRDLSHGEPQAAVYYGFRSFENVILALREAEYDGPENRNYNP